MNPSGSPPGYAEEKAIEAGDYNDGVDRRLPLVGEHGEVINASGHRDQLKRHYGLLSICGLALTIDNAWVALGGSITVSICEQLSGEQLFVLC